MDIAIRLQTFGILMHSPFEDKHHLKNNDLFNSRCWYPEGCRLSEMGKSGTVEKGLT